MKNLYTRSEFLKINNQKEILNEGIINLFKKMWQNVMKIANKIKGSKEITAAYDKYKNQVDDTFNKMGNIEGAKLVKAGFEHTNTNDNKLNEATPVVPAPGSTPTKTPGTPAVGKQVGDDPTDAEGKNKQDISNLTNLKPEQIKKLSDETRKRIEQLKTQFETEVNAIIVRLTKNPNYSSEKLKQFSIVMKNQLQGYVYDKWYDFYTKIGDQKNILDVTKLKKQNEVTYKKSIQDLNTKLGEQQQQFQVNVGGKYTYHSQKNNADVEVEVIGKALGQDEKGKPDNEDPDHKNMWKVKTDKGTFWISPSSFKEEVTPGKVKGATKPGTKKEVGQTYNYTLKTGKDQGKEVVATIVSIDGQNAKITYQGMNKGLEKQGGVSVPLKNLK